MSPPQTMPGVPYVPNSAGLNMTDISGYQPWKALSDFAMHNDMDQGAFQQLVRVFPRNFLLQIISSKYQNLIKVYKFYYLK